MNIGTLEISGRTFLAPLAGITNLPFRLLVKQLGCAVVCSEMVSAKGIFYNSEKTLTLMASDKKEQPLSIQLFGSDPLSMAKGAKVVEELNVASIIDINFGCSVRKIIKQGAGVALMRTPDLSRDVIRSVRKATTLPLTIKIRSGWEPDGHQALEIARIAEDEGVDAIAMHPRTAGQLFRGKANWDLIGKLKEHISIPVIGNGDIACPEDAAGMIKQTGCDAVMVGRAAMKNPFILSQIEALLKTGTYTSPDLQKIFSTMEQLTEMYVNHFGEKIACRMLRGRLAWFIKGMPGAADFRKRLSGLTSKAQTFEMIREFSLKVRA